MLRYGIIGCGMMGQEHLRNIALLDGATVAAIFEPNPGMRATAATLAPGARMVGSVAEVLAVNEVNCLLIASPNHLHLGQLEEIARTRPLPILCEKPLFTNPTDAPRLAALRAAYPRRSGWRWNTAICPPSRICCGKPRLPLVASRC